MTGEQAARARDPLRGAHLTSANRPSPPVALYPPADDLVPLVAHHWVPVWSLHEPSTQRTLQHPSCLLVVSDAYARFYGVVRGLSTTTLEGDGWAVGTTFTAGGGRSVLGRSVASVTGRWVDLREVASLDGDALVSHVRAAMADRPADPASHARAIAGVAERLRGLVVGAQGELVTAVVAWVRDHPEVTRVEHVAREFSLSERSLQRLVGEHVGLSPKWLVQRRRLHDAVARLKAGETTLAALAADLGYTDQAHLTRDFRLVTGTTPGAYLADQPGREPGYR